MLNAALQPRARLDGHGLGWPAFARHYLRDHYCFLFLRLLRCFSSPGRPPRGWCLFKTPGCPIREPTDRGQCAAPRGISLLVAPFLASQSLGIPHAPFFTSSRRRRLSVPPALLPKTSKNIPPSLNGRGIEARPHFRGRAITITSEDGANYVEDNGFEPLTPCVQGRCSSQLS